MFRVDGANPHLIDCTLKVGQPGSGSTYGTNGENGITAENYIFSED